VNLNIGEGLAPKHPSNLAGCCKIFIAGIAEIGLAEIAGDSQQIETDAAD
jgi:hypothetical protein